MKPKTVITVVLLVFVAASVVVLVAKEMRRGQPADQAAQQPIAEKPLTDGWIVYYFHTNTRCSTCRTIEAYAREAVQDGFAEQFKAGRMQWRVVNYEQARNKHFAKEFELVASSVVVVKMQRGARKQWKNLHRVWELVGDKPAYLEYIRGETRALLEAP